MGALTPPEKLQSFPGTCFSSVGNIVPGGRDVCWRLCARLFLEEIEILATSVVSQISVSSPTIGSSGDRSQDRWPRNRQEEIRQGSRQRPIRRHRFLHLVPWALCTCSKDRELICDRFSSPGRFLGSWPAAGVRRSRFW